MPQDALRVSFPGVADDTAEALAQELAAELRSSERLPGLKVELAKSRPTVLSAGDIVEVVAITIGSIHITLDLVLLWVHSRGLSHSVSFSGSSPDVADAVDQHKKKHGIN